MKNKKFIFSLLLLLTITSHSMQQQASLKKIATLAIQKHPDYKQVINTACMYFRFTTGFLSVLQATSIHPRSRAKGFLFEIEKAISITNKNSEQIIAFHALLSNHKTGSIREIDLITTERAIECKTVNWEFYYPESHKIARQLLEQKKLVEQPERIQLPNYRFALCSKKPITNNWKKWLNKHEITFEEE